MKDEYNFGAPEHTNNGIHKPYQMDDGKVWFRCNFGSPIRYDTQAKQHYFCITINHQQWLQQSSVSQEWSEKGSKKLGSKNNPTHKMYTDGGKTTTTGHNVVDTHF